MSKTVNQEALSSKSVDYFFPQKYDVISQLLHSYAKGPICLMRLKSYSHKFDSCTVNLCLTDTKGTEEKCPL